MRKPPFYKSLGFASKGLLWMLKFERNFQLEVIALFLNLFLIIYLKLSKIDAVVILIICGFVLVTEILNTGLEKICDFINPDFHLKIGVIKDIAAAAVLMATVFAVIIGGIIYWPYLVTTLCSKLSFAA